MKNLRRKLGNIDMMNYFHRILWVDIVSNWGGFFLYRVYFTLPALPDNFDSKSIPEFVLKDEKRNFVYHYIFGYRRNAGYYKVYIDLMSIEELQEFASIILKTPKQGILTFDVTRDIEEIINEFKISII